MNISSNNAADLKAVSSREDMKDLNLKTNSKADAIIQYFLFGLLALSIGLSAINNTWIFSFSIGGFTIIAYLACRFFKPASRFLAIATSMCFVVLIGLILNQAQGNIAVHFLYFIVLAALLFYQRKIVYVAFFIAVFIHHSLFIYLQYKGYSGLYLFSSQISGFSSFLFYYLSFTAAILVFVGVCHTWTIRENLHQVQSHEWNKISQNFNKNIEFAKEIASGNLEASYHLSEGDNLGKSILEMRDNLKITYEEDKNRNWTTEGIAKIEEILRLSNNSLDSLAFTVISALVKYLDANQGAVFIINSDNESDKYMELKGCYAYEKKKYQDKKISMGQGLLGQAVIEKDVIVLTEIPERYVKITSGLGEAAPNSLVIIPLQNENEVVGAMEIASFHKFLGYQIDFLKKVAESIASAVLTSKNNYKTSILLDESRELTELLRSQEEEMRQNMEELQATQEELQRNNSEFEEFMEIFNAYYVRIEYDVKGNILNVSSKLTNLTHYDKNELINQKYSSIIEEKSVKEFGEAFWKDVVKNKINEKNIPLKSKTGKTVWLKAYLKPVEYMPGFVRKVNLIGYPIESNEKI